MYTHIYIYPSQKLRKMCSFGNSCGGIRFTKQKQMRPMNYIPKNCVAHGKWIVMPWRLVAVQLELISISSYRTCKRYEVEWDTIVQWGCRGIQWNAGRWNRFICWFHGDFVHICFLGWFHPPTCIFQNTFLNQSYPWIVLSCLLSMILIAHMPSSCHSTIYAPTCSGQKLCFSCFVF